MCVYFCHIHVCIKDRSAQQYILLMLQAQTTEIAYYTSSGNIFSLSYLSSP